MERAARALLEGRVSASMDKRKGLICNMVSQSHKVRTCACSVGIQGQRQCHTQHTHTHTHTEPAVLARLEKLCKARGVTWTVAQYHSQEAEAMAAVNAESVAAKAGDTSQLPAVKEEVKAEEEVKEEVRRGFGVL